MLGFGAGGRHGDLRLPRCPTGAPAEEGRCQLGKPHGHGGTPKRMVYSGKSQTKMDDKWGVHTNLGGCHGELKEQTMQASPMKKNSLISQAWGSGFSQRFSWMKTYNCQIFSCEVKGSRVLMVSKLFAHEVGILATCWNVHCKGTGSNNAGMADREPFPRRKWRWSPLRNCLG